MFRAFGNAVARYWPVFLAAWAVCVVALNWAAPRWEDVAQGGEFGFLPPNFPSRRADALLQQAFPNDLMKSSIVLVLYREDNSPGLTEKDRTFIEEALRPGLEEIAQSEGGLALAQNEAPNRRKHSIIADIRTPADRAVGPLLTSIDGQAALAIVGLTTDFNELRNGPVIEKIERLVEHLAQQQRVPAGLEIAVTGSATLGRDTQTAQVASARAADFWTILLVVILLLIIYRAPLMALVPLVTLYVAVMVAVHSLALLAKAGYLGVFEGLQVYMTVIAYGAGVDYTLFLTARYRESLCTGLDYREALSDAIDKVGAAIVASAGTVICGIAMMAFADFGKFHQAGIGIAFGLFIVLCAVMTFSPTLLRLTGRWAFWPWHPTAQVGDPAGLRPTPSGRPSRPSVWKRIGEFLEKRPGTIWLSCVAVMTPFVVIAILYYNHLMYSLIEQLPANAPSVVGQRVLQRHFPAGITGPATILVKHDKVDFSTAEGEDWIDDLVTDLRERRDELHIADIRSVNTPLGITEAAERGLPRSPTARVLELGARRRRALSYYVSDSPELDHHVTRLDLILGLDPFARESIPTLQHIEAAVAKALPGPLRAGATVLTAGPTASVRDVQDIGNSDRGRINALVLAVVFLILVVLLRTVAISLYLIVSVLFCYLTALGATFLVFGALNPTGFAGLDWTVPTFLFTVLVAVGEDYNIFLMTRVHEEQAQHGLVEGITIALARTGGIITSCGFIMAGTFSALMTGSLARMVQLGFALALGVLLDTFIVRPVLVPAFLLLLAEGYFGSVGKFLVKPRGNSRF